jgi:hypothetical protein
LGICCEIIGRNEGAYTAYVEAYNLPRAKWWQKLKLPLARWAKKIMFKLSILF